MLPVFLQTPYNLLQDHAQDPMFHLLSRLLSLFQAVTVTQSFLDFYDLDKISLKSEFF